MNKEEFVELYAPKHLFNYTLDEARCHHGHAPTLKEACTNFGRGTVIAVIRSFLDHFVDIVGCPQKPNNQQRDTICFHAATRFGGLKITELMLFFYKLMSGQYGKFYNRIELLDVLVPLAQWNKECQAIKQQRAENEAQAIQDREWARRDAEAVPAEIALAKINEIVERFKTKS